MILYMSISVHEYMDFPIVFRAQVDIVRSNVDVLVKEGLGPRSEGDLRLVKDTCTALIKLVPTGKVSHLFTTLHQTCMGVQDGLLSSF